MTLWWYCIVWRCALTEKGKGKMKRNFSRYVLAGVSVDDSGA